MRAFVSDHESTLVHAKVNVSQEDTRELVQTFRVGAVPSYVLVDPSTGATLYRQVGGSPDHDKIEAAMQKSARDDS